MVYGQHVHIILCHVTYIWGNENYKVYRTNPRTKDKLRENIIVMMMMIIIIIIIMYVVPSGT
jgi:heme/copper-type cytochrome/quinol oxidase subunit 2